VLGNAVFSAKCFQIPRAGLLNSTVTVPDFPRIVVNFLRTKYAACGAQSLISRRNHVYVWLLILYGHLNPTTVCHNCALITGQYWIPQQSAKT